MDGRRTADTVRARRAAIQSEFPSVVGGNEECIPEGRTGGRLARYRKDRTMARFGTMGRNMVWGLIGMAAMSVAVVLVTGCDASEPEADDTDQGALVNAQCSGTPAPALVAYIDEMSRDNWAQRIRASGAKFYGCESADPSECFDGAADVTGLYGGAIASQKLRETLFRPIEAISPDGQMFAEGDRVRFVEPPSENKHDVHLPSSGHGSFVPDNKGGIFVWGINSLFADDYGGRSMLCAPSVMQHAVTVPTLDPENRGANKAEMKEMFAGCIRPTDPNGGSYLQVSAALDGKSLLLANAQYLLPVRVSSQGYTAGTPMKIAFPAGVEIAGLGISPSGKLLVTASFEPLPDSSKGFNKLVAWRLKVTEGAQSITPERLGEVCVNHEASGAIAISSDERFVAFANRGVHLLDLKTSKLVTLTYSRTSEPGGFTRPLFRADGWLYMTRAYAPSQNGREFERWSQLLSDAAIRLSKRQ